MSLTPLRPSKKGRPKHSTVEMVQQPSSAVWMPDRCGPQGPGARNSPHLEIEDLAVQGHKRVEEKVERVHALGFGVMTYPKKTGQLSFNPTKSCFDTQSFTG